MINTLLITGCSYGLGRALALKFAQDNLYVYAVGRSKEQLDKLAMHSKNIYPIVADIATETGRLTISEHVDPKKPISIIHNAVFAEPCQFELMNEALLRNHMETNYIGPLLLTKRLLPLLVGGQRVLNISSGAADMSLSGLMPYCTTKAAMQLATKCLNVEMNPKNLYFANLRPGLMDTPLGLKLRSADDQVLPDLDFYIQIEKEEKLISPEVVAEFVSWVMLRTNSINFSETSWNIYEEAHHQHWLPASAKKPML